MRTSLFTFILLFPFSLKAQQCILQKKATLPNSMRETSGLQWIAGGLWTFNDSGNPPTLYQLDSSDGSELKKVSIINYSNTDWEDIAADSEYVYIGDFGNNNGDRKDLRVLRIGIAAFMANGDTSVEAEAITFSYADQIDFTPNSKTNFDCESMLAMGDSLYLFTKNRGDYQTRVYALCKLPGDYSISVVGQYNTSSKITAADISPSGDRIALLGYSSGNSSSRIFILSGFAGNDFFGAKVENFLLTQNAIDWQTEGLGFTSDNRIFISCEATSGFNSGIYAIEFSYLLLNPVSTQKILPDTINLYPVPGTNEVYLKGLQQNPGNNIQLTDLNGREFSCPIQATDSQQYRIDLSQLPPGIYLLTSEFLPGRILRIVRK